MLPKEGKVVLLSPHVITRRFFPILDKLKIKHFRFHVLRHCSASIMHAIGIPDQYIMARGGCGSDKVLKAIYRGAIDYYKNDLQI
ncbi:MAG TPA: hypothetical protein DHW61_12890 [Lachnoclostridium phytofermentans]|uniref:Tyr recombinase domain-containing protein n=1 Tax=Lachnoclostridium phytofermentans TaxID=66219 RepID=A0A3D2X809_9FIRM|nr:hypothetical protein [Lachnoclostridium phytofermentans]